MSTQHNAQARQELIDAEEALRNVIRATPYFVLRNMAKGVWRRIPKHSCSEETFIAAIAEWSAEED